MLRKICLNTLVRVNRKRGFWHILETTLILKATHEVNLDFRFDLKSTLISKNSSSTLLGQPWFKDISWSQPLFQGWFQNWPQVNLDFKIQFLHSLKLRLISKATLKSTLISKDNLYFLQVNNFTMSHSWVLKRVWILSSWMILFSRHQRRWKSNLFDRLKISYLCFYTHHYSWISQFLLLFFYYLLPVKIKSLHLQACFMISYNRIGIKLWWMIFILLISDTLKLSVDDVELSFWRDEDVTFHIPKPDSFPLIASWTPSFVFTNFNPPPRRSLSLILLRSMKWSNLSPA